MRDKMHVNGGCNWRERFGPLNWMAQRNESSIITPYKTANDNAIKCWVVLARNWKLYIEMKELRKSLTGWFFVKSFQLFAFNFERWLRENNCISFSIWGFSVFGERHWAQYKAATAATVKLNELERRIRKIKQNYLWICRFVCSLSLSSPIYLEEKKMCSKT